MPGNEGTPFEERAEELTRLVRVFQVRLNKVQKGSPEHEALLRNLAAVSVLKVEIEILLDDAEGKTLTNV